MMSHARDSLHPAGAIMRRRKSIAAKTRLDTDLWCRWLKCRSTWRLPGQIPAGRKGGTLPNWTASCRRRKVTHAVPSPSGRNEHVWTMRTKRRVEKPYGLRRGGGHPRCHFTDFETYCCKLLTFERPDQPRARGHPCLESLSRSPSATDSKAQAALPHSIAKSRLRYRANRRHFDSLSGSGADRADGSPV